jgi:hypothetical protein
MKNQELLQIVKTHTSEEHQWEVVEGQGRATVRCIKCRVVVHKGTRLCSCDVSPTKIEEEGVEKRIEIATGSDIRRSARLSRRNNVDDGLIRCNSSSKNE